MRYIQEKFAKVSIRNCLSNLYTTFRSAKDEGPRMIIGSLTSEHENLDTLIHIIVAQNIGWDVTYVGNSIPHDEMTYMANKIDARTKRCLKLVYSSITVPVLGLWYDLVALDSSPMTNSNKSS